MPGYQPLYIKGVETGLVQEREEFILPDDAYPILENAFLWRERIKRKQGYQLLGRLRRVLTAQALGNLDGAGNFSGNIRTILGLQINAQIEVGTLVISDGVNTFTDNGLGVLVGAPGGSGTVNYSTTAITITGGVPGAAITAALNYFPGLPVMGLRSRELNNINSEQLIAFDQVYAYRFGASGWEEFLPGFTWTGNDSQFFWTTNYWVDTGNNKIFWATNDNDPIRYTNGATVWVDFAPIINAALNTLTNALILLPFRGRLVAFNTTETAGVFTNRIRWAAIGTPFTVVAGIPVNVNANAWRDDIRGQGGFLDIPTSEDIVAVGFVRDNLVIYCERSTWQLRYTGRTIAPFQIEKVNSELGAESTFSAVQFDTSLVGIGDKGVVECDSFKSERIDIKIPDLVFYFNNDANGPKRVHGIRDFQQRLAYWTYPYKPEEQVTDVFPNRRLVYNYENDSWAIFIDSLTTLGTFQAQSGRRWQDYTLPDVDIWSAQNYPWVNRPSLFPSIVGGNQQGYVEYLDSQVKNDVSLTISNITGNVTTATRITSPSHNLETNQIVQIIGIPAGTPFATSLNNNIFQVQRIDNDNIDLYVYFAATDTFFLPQLDPIGTYVGGGQMAILDNFRIVSKKFNFLDQGQTIQLGYIDILMDSTTNGAITLNVYLDYNDDSPSNRLIDNQDPVTGIPDAFFNATVPTSKGIGFEGDKYWHRVFCPTRASFLTIEWTLSNLQMIGDAQESDVQIDAQILWMRPAGKQLPQGF